MNTHRLMVATALACFSSLGVAHADTAGPPPTPYQYGYPLNIERVTAMDEPMTQVCELVTAEMRYVNTSGQTEAITYLKLSNACNRNQN